MLKLYVWLKDLLRSERGQDMVEYALITVIISVAIVLATIFILGTAFTTWATDLASCITAPGGANCPFNTS
ncbi:MAG: Flp family type IVb pilin [Dehalococcoidia bacterium]|nr:MAG: Flp family type IVb pilin [Dehalococcoidia bacterium]